MQLRLVPRHRCRAQDERQLGRQVVHRAEERVIARHARRRRVRVRLPNEVDVLVQQERVLSACGRKHRHRVDRQEVVGGSEVLVARAQVARDVLAERRELYAVVDLVLGQLRQRGKVRRQERVLDAILNSGLELGVVHAIGPRAMKPLV